MSDPTAKAELFELLAGLNLSLDDAPSHPMGMRVSVNPYDNVLLGSNVILRYLGIRSMATLYEYIELYGLPCIKTPDGMWMTTMTAIDSWIFIAAQADRNNRTHSRGSNKRHDIALKILRRRFGEDSKEYQLAEKRELAAQAAEGGRLKPGPKTNASLGIRKS